MQTVGPLFFSPPSIDVFSQLQPGREEEEEEERRGRVFKYLCVRRWEHAFVGILCMSGVCQYMTLYVSSRKQPTHICVKDVKDVSTTAERTHLMLF